MTGQLVNHFCLDYMRVYQNVFLIITDPYNWMMPQTIAYAITEIL